jgi:hypothetical protein
MRGLRWLAGAALLVSLQPLIAQDTAKPKSTVIYVAEQQNVPAGKKTMVEVHFTVIDGYHVNSHTPKSDFLIPTVLKVQPAAGVVEAAPEYSTGHDFSFAFDPSNKLDVYTGTFTVKLPVVAAAGSHTLDATLHYQACDHAACYPPKSLPLQVLFTAQ